MLCDSPNFTLTSSNQPSSSSIVNSNNYNDLPSTPTLTITPVPSGATHLLGSDNENDCEMDVFSSYSISAVKDTMASVILVKNSIKSATAANSNIQSNTSTNLPSPTNPSQNVAIPHTRTRTKSNRAHPHIHHHPTIHPHNKYSRSKNNSISGDSNSCVGNSSVTPTSPLSPIPVTDEVINKASRILDESGKELEVDKNKSNKDNNSKINKPDDDDFDLDSSFDDESSDMPNTSKYVFLDTINLNECGEEKVRDHFFIFLDSR